MVRAKFTCVEVTKLQAWGTSVREKKFMYRAKFTPVIQGSDENKKFYALTPGGSIELATYEKDHFVPGVEYYVDFVDATFVEPAA